MGKRGRPWLRAHQGDEFVRRSWSSGYRSRATFKLSEIDRRDRLLSPGMTVLDLGAAPGGWSQWAACRVAPHGRVIAVDILAMAPLPGVEFIQGDVQEEGLRAELIRTVGEATAGLVMSDMAPNTSGIQVVDQSSSMLLAEIVLEVGERVIRPGGALLVKVFQGEGYDSYALNLRARFAEVVTRKPRASRTRSREVYLLARGYRAEEGKTI